MEKYPVKYEESMNTVLVQEVRRKCYFLFTSLSFKSFCGSFKFFYNHFLLCSIAKYLNLFFLFLQVIRYNNLLVVIKRTLRDLLKALKGLVVMSEALEKMFNSLYNNTVPQLWASKVSFGVYMYIVCVCHSGRIKHTPTLLTALCLLV